MLEGIAIRWRLALLSAGLTLVILSGFAVVIGQVTSSRVRSDFNNELEIRTRYRRRYRDDHFMFAIEDLQRRRRDGE